MKSKVMKMVGAAVLCVAALTTLTGCGPSACEKAGGVDEFSHYLPITQMMPNGNGGFTYYQQLIPQYTCNMEGVQE